MRTTIFRTFSELSQLQTFEERFDYLQLSGRVGEETFGHERYLNQQFYTSYEWRQARRDVIARDYGCDLGIEGFDIRAPDKIFVHHMNPIVPDDIIHANGDILNPEFLISVSQNTHQAIHYGDFSLIPTLPRERTPGDTNLW